MTLATASAEVSGSLQQCAKPKLTREDRAAGALMGVLVGDALGVGMQWYYDMEQKDKDFGPWVTDYVDPKPDGEHVFAYVSKYRHEQGFRAGDTSQMGQIYSDLLESVADLRKYDRDDFYARLDQLMSTLSGESLSGRYTDGIINDVRKKRLDGLDWGDKDMGTDHTTGDGAVLSVVLAALYSDPVQLARAADDLITPLMADSFIRGNSVVFALTVQALINGVPIDKLALHVKTLGFNKEIRAIGGAFDNFLTPGYGAAATQPGLDSIEPKLISQLFGPDCQLTHLLPAAYYLVHRLPNDFEQAVLSASNGPGQNVVRAALTGALSGALNGACAIPERFVKNLENSKVVHENAQRVASLSTFSIETKSKKRGTEGEAEVAEEA